MMDYSTLIPRPGYVVLKEVADSNEGKVLLKSSEQESRAMGKVIALPIIVTDRTRDLKIGDLVVYNEYEGQELFKHGDVVTEDHIIVLKEENVILKINEKPKEIPAS
jgi:co-chaperonin GroES (HSP10)